MSASGRKVPAEFENPFDNIILGQIDQIMPLLDRLRVTPNQITMLSFAFALLAIYQLYYYNNYKLFVLYYTISYILDCLDGHYARHSKQTSQLGDFFGPCY